jgi:DNA modification methylase
MPGANKVFGNPEFNEGRPSREATETVGYRDVCGKCGATRIDQQLGLEPTPEEYVTRMVEVFREVRRVLANHGTVWLNLGDSYASQGARGDTRSGFNERYFGSGNLGKQAATAAEVPPNSIPAGLKPKDLVGIPWRVAFALQADGWCLRSDIVWAKPNPMPESVTDRPTKAHEYIFLLSKCEWKGIEDPLRLDRADAMWLAAMMDGEGTICVNTRKDKDYQPTYSAALRCYNTSRALIERVAELAGCGTITKKTNSGEDGTRECWQWQCGGKTAVPVLDAIEPYLIAKRQQAHLLLELQGMRRHHGAQAGFGKGMKPRPASVTRRQEEIARGCSELNKTGETDVQVFSWKRGYWKPLPYHFDQEAVRESKAPSSMARYNSPRFGVNNKGADPNSGYAVSGGDYTDREREQTNRNIRSVWEIPTQPYPEAHFATFPEELARRCIAAGCPEQVCRVCGKARERVMSERPYPAELANAKQAHGGIGNNLGGQRHQDWLDANPRQVVGFTDCGHDAYEPGLTLDPFIGSGTVAYVARKLGRHAVGIDLSEEYLKLAARRLQQQSLFSEVL